MFVLKILERTSLLLLLIGFAACEQKNQKALISDSTNVNKKKEAPVYFSGKADLPKDKFQITSAGLGDFILGDSLGRFLSLYQAESKRINDELRTEDGKQWPAKRLYLQNGKYILVEMVNTIDLVTVVRTDDPVFKTKSGIYAGLLLDSLNQPIDSIKVDFVHKAFTFGSDGVWFKFDATTEKKYFKSQQPSHQLLKGAKIEELFIVCGDC